MLSKIILNDFKGVREGEYTFTQFVNSVCGKNGTGKSTLADAWFWFWTDKDYELQTNPEIHPDFMAESEPTVTIIWDTGKQQVVLRKIQQDTRTKKQKMENAPVRVANKYEINSVPKTQKDFAEDVKKMGIDIDNILKFTHTEFLFDMTVAKRREVIFALAGNISDIEVAETIPNCGEAKEQLTMYGFDEVMAMQKATVKRCKDQLDSIPQQIIGMERSKVVIDPDIASKKETLEQTIATKTEELESCQAQSDTKVFDEQIRQIENDKTTEYNKANTERLVKLSAAQEAQTKAYTSYTEAKNVVTAIDASGQRINNGYRLQSETKKNLQAELDVVKAEAFSCDTVCPTCGQDIPKERIESAKEKWQKAHDEKILSLAQRIKACDTMLANYKAEGGNLAKTKQEAVQKMNEYANKYNAAKYDVTTYSTPIQPDLSEYDNKIAEIRKQKSGADEFARNANTLKYEINAAKTELANVIKQIGQESVNVGIDEKIAELKAKITEYSQAQANAEKILYQLSLISMRKNELLSGKVNEQFTRVKWRLFVTQKNGEVKDDCTPLVLCSDGKYRDMTYSANTAAVQAAKLDICRGLQKYYGQELPIFLDGAECFDETSREALRSMDAQLILLCVTEDERLVII